MTLRARRHVLESGLTVISVDVPHLHSAMVAVYVRSGSRHETKANNGASHFLEHLFFRGSHQYPDTVAMNAAVEGVGGNLNGITTRDCTYFFTPCAPEGVGLCLDILGDMLTRPSLSKIEIERRIILEEMLDEVDSEGRDVDIENLSKRLIFDKHPLALKIAGTRESVTCLTRAQLVAHYRRAYVAGNMVVGVAGPIDSSTVARRVARAFSRVPRGPRLVEEAPSLAWNGLKYKGVPESEPQVEFRLSFPTVSELHPDAMGVQLLRRVLDDGLSSRLPYNVVERRGLAYSVGANVETFHDAGLFEIDGACAPQNAAPMLREVLKTLGSLSRGLIEASELTRAKARHRIHLGFLQDSPADLLGWFGGNELFRTVPSFDHRSREAARVTRRALVALAQRTFRKSNVALTAVGPQRALRALKQVMEQGVGL